MPLTFKIDTETYAIELVSDAGKYKLTGANGDEFPKDSELEGGSNVEIDGDTLAINRTFCCWQR